jgi:predicted dehydrogenase
MIKMAQYGTKHGHAAGKLRAMQSNVNVEVVGVFEPDTERRAEMSQSGSAFEGVRWFDSEDEMLGDDSIVAIASEGANIESLDQTETMVRAGKHVWYDKPAGENWEQWQRIVSQTQSQNLQIQMGFMSVITMGIARSLNGCIRDFWAMCSRCARICLQV